MNDGVSLLFRLRHWKPGFRARNTKLVTVACLILFIFFVVLPQRDSLATSDSAGWCEDKKSQLLTDAEEWLSKWFTSTGNPDPQTVVQLQNLVDWIPAKIADCTTYYSSEDVKILKAKVEEISKTLLDAGYVPSLKASNEVELGSQPPAILDQSTNKWCEDRSAELDAGFQKWYSVWLDTMENPGAETVEQLELLAQDTDKRLAGCTPYLRGETVSLLQTISNNTHDVLDGMTAGLYALPHAFDENSTRCREWFSKLEDWSADIDAKVESGKADLDREDYLSSLYKYNLDVDRYNTQCLGLLTTSAEQSAAESNDTSIQVASEEIALSDDTISYYTYVVPEGVVNPRLTGQYQVLHGETISINVLEQEGCPTPSKPSECISIYSVSNRDHGNFAISLVPGKTYYLEFSNDEIPSSDKTATVDFHIEYD